MTIFVSYSRANEDVVKTLQRAFEEARRDVWFDHELDGGDIWWKTILDNIRQCSVFVFALSDESLASKACMAEYRYAVSLHRPILPVMVGHVSDLQGSPLGDIQYVPFHDDFTTGAAVLAAVDRKAAPKVPLPDPLPAEPPIPLGYLKAVRRQIDTSEPDLSTQLQIVDQLGCAVGEETEPKGRAEIRSILLALLAKPWRAQRTGFAIEIVLGALAKMEDEIAKLSGNGPTVRLPQPGRAEELPPQTAPGFDPETAFFARYGDQNDTAGSAPSTDTTRSAPPPDTGRSAPSSDTAESAASSKEIFEQRMEEMFRQMQAGAAVREAARVQPQAEPEPPAQESTWPGVGLTGPGHFGVAEPVTAIIEPPPEPPGPTSPGPAQGAAATPSRRALGVTGLVLAMVGGVVAVATTGTTTPFLVLVVPFVVAAAAAVVALRFSVQVGRRGRAGDVDGAGRASHTAMVWGAVALTLVGAVVGLVALLLVLVASP